MLTSLAVALVLILGIGGTVAAADNARPGDALFGIDRATENLRLRLTTDAEARNELRVRFADERVREIEDITSRDASMERPAATEVTESSVTEIEADAFTNETVIKIEYGAGNKKFVFTSEADTRAEVVDDINANFPNLSKAFIESRLDFEIEDRASRADDRKVRASDDDLSDDDKANVSVGVSAALELLNDVSASLEGDAAARLKLVIDQLNEFTEVRLNEEGNKTRVELRTEEGRIRVEIKDGEIRIKEEGRSSSSDDDDDDSRSSGSSDSSGSSGSSGSANLEIEADIFTNETVVKVEINDSKSTFTTSANTRAEIIAAVQARYPNLTTQQIDAVLDLEIEDRSSLLKDIVGGSNDDDDNDDGDDDSSNSGSGHSGGSDDDDDEDDENDDNSGSNSGSGGGSDDEDDDD